MNIIIRAAFALFFLLYSCPVSGQDAGVTYFSPSWTPCGEAVLSRAGGGFAEFSAGFRRKLSPGSFLFLGPFARAGFSGASGSGVRISAGLRPLGGPVTVTGALDRGKSSHPVEGAGWFLSPSVSLSAPLGGFAGNVGVLALVYRKAGAGDFTGSGLMFRFSVLF